jgi:hypothetical protein
MDIYSQEEFSKKLKKLYCWKNRFSNEAILEALIMNDEEKKNEIIAFKKGCDELYEKKMKEYNAGSLDAKKKIIGSVKKMV